MEISGTQELSNFSCRSSAEEKRESKEREFGSRKKNSLFRLICTFIFIWFLITVHRVKKRGTVILRPWRRQ